MLQVGRIKLAVGDTVISIATATAAQKNFRPAAGVTVMITALGNVASSWFGYETVALPVVGNTFRNFNSDSTAKLQCKIPITNDAWLTWLGGTAYQTVVSGIQIK